MSHYLLLIADDDEDDIFLFTEGFASCAEAYEILSVKDGVQLIDFLEQRILNKERLPDLLFLDINMPKMNGIKTLEVLKDNPLFFEIPVLMCSTTKDPEVKKLCRHLGAQGFITKAATQKKRQACAETITVFLQRLKHNPHAYFRSRHKISLNKTSISDVE